MGSPLRPCIWDKKMSGLPILSEKDIQTFTDYKRLIERYDVVMYAKSRVAAEMGYAGTPIEVLSSDTGDVELNGSWSLEARTIYACLLGAHVLQNGDEPKGFVDNIIAVGVDKSCVSG